MPTLHFHDDKFTVLRKGGPVLGPSPDVRYARGYVLMQRDDILVFYTDGITEAPCILAKAFYVSGDGIGLGRKVSVAQSTLASFALSPSKGSSAEGRFDKLTTNGSKVVNGASSDSYLMKSNCS